MDQKILPNLKSINIKNFSLYPGNLNLHYHFIEGVNLIIGGNGVGKTTFLNLVKFALIGLYRKGVDVKRREFRGIEYRYDKRVNLPYRYFYNRMDFSVNYNESAEVTIVFVLGDKEFEVTRLLYNPCVSKVIITEKGIREEITGNLMFQSEYDNLFLNKEKNEKLLSQSLQGKLEFELSNAAGHEKFDELIFLINDVLFFSEQRNTIMWNSDFQTTFSSIYFIEPKLLTELTETQLDAKYYDSLARHKSEDIRAINKIFEKFTDSTLSNKDYKELVSRHESYKKKAEVTFKSLDKIQKEREQIEVNISKVYTAKNQLSKKLSDLDILKRTEEEVVFKDIFKKVTPKYYDYLKHIKSSRDCPLCNNELSETLRNKIITDDLHCMMCGNNIKNTQLTSTKLNEIKNQIIIVLNEKNQKEKEIILEEEKLEIFDEKFRDTNINLNNLLSEIRKLEFAIQKSQTEDSPNTDTEFKTMKARIDELEKEKETASNTSKIAYDKAARIIEIIDKQRLNSTKVLSEMFNKFGNKFLGVPCDLVYEDPKIDDEGKRYLPRINGIDRYNEEELSESQRFFIDQSFRMSLLNFFNSGSSFFMCETPDSSLDISYEKNAAKVYLEYIKQPNALILTSNLNNSEFLEYLIEEAKNINYINLLKIGKKSAIQSNSLELNNASIKIEKIINEKRKR